MGAIASQITSLTIVYSTVYPDADQRKHQSSASLVFVWGIHRGPVNSPHKRPVTRKMFPFDDVIMMKVTAHEYAWDVNYDLINRVCNGHQAYTTPENCSHLHFELNSHFEVGEPFHHLRYTCTPWSDVVNDTNGRQIGSASGWGTQQGVAWERGHHCVTTIVRLVIIYNKQLSTYCLVRM